MSPKLVKNALYYERGFSIYKYKFFIKIFYPFFFTKTIYYDYRISLTRDDKFYHPEPRYAEDIVFLKEYFEGLWTVKN